MILLYSVSLLYKADNILFLSLSLNSESLRGCLHTFILSSFTLKLLLIVGINALEVVNTCVKLSENIFLKYIFLKLLTWFSMSAIFFNGTPCHKFIINLSLDKLKP